MSAALQYYVRKVAAIEAVAAGRFVEASTIIRELLEEPPIRPRPGQCRYCGCTKARGCGILVDPGHEYQPGIVTCSWADDEQTVCTNVTCLERWRQESPAEMDVDVHDVVQAHSSRIVRP
jgi:hypothetical protein